MCRWMGSHFHGWIDYNGVAFSIELLELWKVWTQESFQRQVEFDRPGERSPE